MSISPLYIPLFTIEEVILDKDSGLPLSGGVVTFFRDSQRLTPKPIFKIAGVSPNYTFTSIGASVTLGIAGDFVDANGDPFVPYAYPYDAAGAVDLYFVRVVSEGLVPQFTREAVPYLGADVIPPEDRENTANELSNPQFVEILFPSGIAFDIHVTGSNTVTPIAPGWDLITSGTGIVTLQRLEPTSASVPTNPPFTLSIAAVAALGASVTLRQRLSNTPSIGRGRYGSGSILAAVISGGGSAISMTYAPSTGTPTTIIGSTNISTDGAYHVIANNATIPQQANTAASTGYVDVNIVIPTSRTIAISSIQLVFVATSVDIPFDEQTAARQKDHLFHYYENSLVTQSKQNLLSGWNFGINPWQFADTAAQTIVPKTVYITDQTILYQETASAIQVGRASYDRNYGLQLAAINGVAANRFAIIQYIDTTTMAPYWGQILSCLNRALYFHSTGALPIPNLKMRLIWRTTSVPVISAVEPITGFDVDGNPTFAAGWNSINPLNDAAYPMTLSSSLTNVNRFPAYAFDQFNLPAPVFGTVPLYLGVVVYIDKPMNNDLGTVDYVVFDRISLTPNDFAIDSCIETFDESFKRCQYYFEKSYNVEKIAGTAGVAAENEVSMILPSASSVMYGMDRPFKATKRVNPSVAWYSPQDGTPGRVYDGTGAANLVVSSTVGSGKNSTGVPSLSAPATAGHIIVGQWTADARLGII